jgi:hypothetical protein
MKLSSTRSLIFENKFFWTDSITVIVLVIDEKASNPLQYADKDDEFRD